MMQPDVISVPRTEYYTLAAQVNFLHLQLKKFMSPEHAGKAQGILLNASKGGEISNETKEQVEWVDDTIYDIPGEHCSSMFKLVEEVCYDGDSVAGNMQAQALPLEDSGVPRSVLAGASSTLPVTVNWLLDPAKTDPVPTHKENITNMHTKPPKAAEEEPVDAVYMSESDEDPEDSVYISESDDGGEEDDEKKTESGHPHLKPDGAVLIIESHAFPLQGEHTRIERSINRSTAGGQSDCMGTYMSECATSKVTEAVRVRLRSGECPSCRGQRDTVDRLVQDNKTLNKQLKEILDKQGISLNAYMDVQQYIHKIAGLKTDLDGVRLENSALREAVSSDQVTSATAAVAPGKQLITELVRMDVALSTARKNSQDNAQRSITELEKTKKTCDQKIKKQKDDFHAMELRFEKEATDGRKEYDEKLRRKQEECNALRDVITKKTAENYSLVQRCGRLEQELPGASELSPNIPPEVPSQNNLLECERCGQEFSDPINFATHTRRCLNQEY